MSSHGRILDNLFGLADAFIPMLKLTPVGPYVEAASQLVAMIDGLKGSLPGPDALVLEVKRDELDKLLAEVNEHADKTRAALRGDEG